MPILRGTNWDYGTPKARYRKDELQLRQPKGFPITPLKITLERARKESRIEAAAKEYAGSNFEIYEDLEGLEENDYVEVEDEDDVEEAEDTADEAADDSAYNSADSSADDSDASADLTVFRTIAEKPAPLVDSRGRTRAATNRRKNQEASDSTMPTIVSSEDGETAAVGQKDRKRCTTQAVKQPRKISAKKST
jgi:hypothetical protein